jgi:hypothetical protein
MAIQNNTVPYSDHLVLQTLLLDLLTTIMITMLIGDNVNCNTYLNLINL